MNVAAALSWANDNAPAITAVATIFLVAITAIYVVVTYLLVREQRAQGQTPDVAIEWAESDVHFADLELRNVGSGTATQLTILKGPGDGVSVDETFLGIRRTLLPGEKSSWKIRPADGRAQFERGELPLTLSYLDTHRGKVLFEVFVIRCHEGDQGIEPDFTGSGAKWWTRREVRRLTLKSLPRHKRPQFRWTTRKTRLSLLLLDDEVRAALSQELSSVAQSLQAVSHQAESVQRHI
jgi:hypothetical protein